MLKKEYFDYSDIKNGIRDRVLQKLDLHSDISDGELYNLIDDEIISCNDRQALSLNVRIMLREDLYNSFRKLDVLQRLVDDKSITEIMINSYEDIFIERNGKLCKWEGKFESIERYNDVIQMIVSKINRVVNESSPIADARLEDGSRVNIVLSPVALDGNAVTIRKFPEKVYRMDDLISKGTLNQEVAEFLDILVKSRYNILLSGGTSSGKTTMLNALAGFISPDERIITIEDSAELQINNIPNIVRMEVKNANMEGNKDISIRDLIKASLRMRPDRIIVGEVRDSAAIDLLSAYNTGHDGSISTAHSNSASDMMARLESMVLMGVDMPVSAIRRQIVSAIDIIIHVARLRDRSRKIVEISEVTGMENNEIKLNSLYRFVEYGSTADCNTTADIDAALNAECSNVPDGNVGDGSVQGFFLRNSRGLTDRHKLDNAGNREWYEKIFERYK